MSYNCLRLPQNVLSLIEQTQKYMFICMFNIDILIMLSIITGKEINKCARNMHFYTYTPSDILWDIRQTV